MCVVLQKPVHNSETLLLLFADDDILCPDKKFVHYKKKLNPKYVFLFQRSSNQSKVDVWYDSMPLGRTSWKMLCQRLVRSSRYHKYILITAFVQLRCMFLMLQISLVATL